MFSNRYYVSTNLVNYHCKYNSVTVKKMLHITVIKSNFWGKFLKTKGSTKKLKINYAMEIILKVLDANKERIKIFSKFSNLGLQ